MIRTPLCTYYSSDASQLLRELQNAYLALSAKLVTVVNSPKLHHEHALDPFATSSTPRLLALVVPHGAACDGFYVAAHAYRELNDYCKRVRCQHLTAVLIGTEHRGTTPIALSRKASWATPLGHIPVDTAAVDYLTNQHNIPVNEAPHTTEHSIENQLPFLQHGAMYGWDLTAAGCAPPTAAATVAGSSTAAAAAGAVPHEAVLSIVSISIGYLGSQPQLIQQYGAAVADLLDHLRQQQHSSSSSSGSKEVVMIVTSDFTHAGPWYRELPPAGVKLEDYMVSQDNPVLQAIQQGSVEALLAAAVATRNSMCGLYPLAVALEALYGSGSSTYSSGSSRVQAGKPHLLHYKPAHLIYPRSDSTGFAAFAVWQQQQQQQQHQ